MGLFGQTTHPQKGASSMFRDIFPLRNRSKDPEKQIDCGPFSTLELLTGKQRIAFDIKGEATLSFDLRFRLYQHQLVEYAKQLQKEYPQAELSVSANRLNVTLKIPYLCDTYPISTPLTPCSYVHDQTWNAVRQATRVVDDIYGRVLEMHFERVLLEAKHGEGRTAEAIVEDTGDPKQ